MAESRERLALAWLCSSVADTTVAISATPLFERLVHATLVQRQRDAMRARQGGNRRHDVADIDELRKGFCRQERADLEMAHAGRIFVADPLLLR